MSLGEACPSTPSYLSVCLLIPRRRPKKCRVYCIYSVSIRLYLFSPIDALNTLSHSISFIEFRHQELSLSLSLIRREALTTREEKIFNSPLRHRQGSTCTVSTALYEVGHS